MDTLHTYTHPHAGLAYPFAGSLPETTSLAFAPDEGQVNDEALLIQRINRSIDQANQRVFASPERVAAVFNKYACSLDG
jgi:hypothetical protein